MDLNEIYTPFEEAKEELTRRWNDLELKKKVDAYLKNFFPEGFLDIPRAICTSHVASPNWAFFHFFIKSKEAKLTPTVFEYLDDLFVTTNFDKASLGKMVFYHGRKDNGEMHTSSKHVIDLSGINEKKRLKDVETSWGEKLVDFHHRALNEFYEGIEVHDGSESYHKMGKCPSEYYKQILALYIRNGILFENFLLRGKEEKFTNEVLLPAFVYVKDYFGLKPLIVPIAPKNEQDNKYWWCYPEFIKILIDRKNEK